MHDSADNLLPVMCSPLNRGTQKNQMIQRDESSRLLAYPLLYSRTTPKEKMRSGASSSTTILFDQNDFRAVKCAKCGTKIYPAALLDAHVVRHKKRDRWFNDDLRKLQHTFWHMRDPA
jgi:hypothetical protein